MNQIYEPHKPQGKSDSSNGLNMELEQGMMYPCKEDLFEVLYSVW